MATIAFHLCSSRSDSWQAINAELLSYRRGSWEDAAANERSPMAIAMTCPHCKTRRVETVRDAWYVQGFLIFARYGSTRYVGCVDCTRTKVVSSLLQTLLLGWWCFPWGVGTPFVLLQNLGQLTAGPDTQGLRALLEKQGLDYDDFVLDEHGRTRGAARTIAGVTSTLHGAIWADGVAQDAEIATAVRIGGKLLDDLVTEAELRAVLQRPQPPEAPDLATLSTESKMMLLKAACSVAAADGEVAAQERAQLRDLGRRLSLPEALVERFLGSLELRRNDEHGELRRIAAAVLGLVPDASPALVRTAYDRLRVQASELPDTARDARLQELAFAYETLLASAA